MLGKSTHNGVFSEKVATLAQLGPNCLLYCHSQDIKRIFALSKFLDGN